MPDAWVNLANVYLAQVRPAGSPSIAPAQLLLPLLQLVLLAGPCAAIRRAAGQLI